MRGQAFVVFRDVSSAAIAKRQLDGFEFFSRHVVVNYAKSKSDAVSKLDGTYFTQLQERKQKMARKIKMDENELAEENTDSGSDSSEEMESEAEENEALSQGLKKREIDDSEEQDSASKKQKMDENSPENESNVLFIDNLPDVVTNEMLLALCGQYPGFREVRRVPGKPYLAFIDYDTVSQAIHARDILNGFKISPTISLQISFAKV
ncbi:hypothetical protein BB560_002842 [Smittium megazygosporum]|uniref:RRM domain-containing protein n=1 Tax=Smittium megazygosporum TaxID=133381 RepID=A0A2T9ZDN5_9FUNG|nr:hypothetical protein BB560_002842 [Smittium megazygosporum]